MSTNTEHMPTQENHPPMGREIVWIIRLLLAAVIVACAVLGYKKLLATSPQRKMRPIVERAAVVEVQALARTSMRTTVSATGLVVPVRELSVQARVSGEVTEVNPALEPGSRVSAGDLLVRIDDADYKLALDRANVRVAQENAALSQKRIALLQAKSQLIQAESQLVNAEYSHKVELGYQDVAKHEWNMLEGKADATELEKELTLRKPHLRKAEADVASAKAGVAVAKEAIDAANAAIAAAEASVRDAETAVEQARLALERTEIRAPFDALVMDRPISTGSQVSTQTTLVSLVDARAFWVEVSVPMARVPWIRVRTEKEAGAKALLRPSGSMSGQAQWTGEVVRRMPALEASGRQVQYLVEVANPLDGAELPLMLDSFVELEIAGVELGDVFAIPRSALHDGNRIWLRNGEGRLDVREVQVVWGDGETVLVRDGLEDGQSLVVSDVASPVPGMKLSLPGEEPENKPDEGASSDSPESGTSESASKGTKDE